MVFIFCIRLFVLFTPPVGGAARDPGSGPDSLNGDTTSSKIGGVLAGMRGPGERIGRLPFAGSRMFPDSGE